MPKTDADVIHTLTSTFMEVLDFQVGTSEVWEDDGKVVGKGVVMVVSGLYVTDTNTVGESNEDRVKGSDGDGEMAVTPCSRYVVIPPDLARTMARCLDVAADECGKEI